MSKTKDQSPKDLADVYDTPEHLFPKEDGVDAYGRVKPRYIQVTKPAYERIIDGQTTYDVIKEEGFSVEHLPAITNPRAGKALYKVAETGILTLIMSNFEDDRNA